MKIKFKQFKEKSFFIPLTKDGQWSHYKNFSGQEWRNNIVNVLKLTIAAVNPTLPKDKLQSIAQQQVDSFVQQIKQNISPQTPCLAMAFAPAQCWFVAFVVDAFVPFENKENNNIFAEKHYAEAEQTIEISKAHGDPVLFAYNLVSSLEE